MDELLQVKKEYDEEQLQWKLNERRDWQQWFQQALTPEGFKILLNKGTTGYVFYNKSIMGEFRFYATPIDDESMKFAQKVLTKIGFNWRQSEDNIYFDF